MLVEKIFRFALHLSLRLVLLYNNGEESLVSIKILGCINCDPDVKPYMKVIAGEFVGTLFVLGKLQT